jgi:hypothetical protein
MSANEIAEIPPEAFHENSAVAGPHRAGNVVGLKLDPLAVAYLLDLAVSTKLGCRRRRGERDHQDRQRKRPHASLLRQGHFSGNRKGIGFQRIFCADSAQPAAAIATPRGLASIQVEDCADRFVDEGVDDGLEARAVVGDGAGGASSASPPSALPGACRGSPWRILSRRRRNLSAHF